MTTYLVVPSMRTGVQVLRRFEGRVVVINLATDDWDRPLHGRLWREGDQVLWFRSLADRTPEHSERVARAHDVLETMAVRSGCKLVQSDLEDV